jgi:hypothetical protein
MLSAGFLIRIKLWISSLSLFDYQSESVANFIIGFNFIVNIRIIHSVHTVSFWPHCHSER